MTHVHLKFNEICQIGQTRVSRKSTEIYNEVSPDQYMARLGNKQLFHKP